MSTQSLKFDKHGKLSQITAQLTPDHLVRVTKRRRDWQYRIYAKVERGWQQISEGEGVSLEAALNIARSVVAEV